MGEKNITMKIVGRRISIVLSVMIFVLIGFLVFWIVREDSKRIEVVNGEVNGEVKDGSPIKADRGRDYGEAGFRKVAENKNFVLSADMTTGEIAVKEKKSGKIWYSNPIDYEEDKQAISKRKLRSQIIITCVSTNKEILGNKKEYTGYGDSVSMGGLDYKLVDNGIEFSYSFPACGIIIPVRYTLGEEGFVAEIPADDIQELWSEEYILNTVELLPFFGMGGIKDEGYLFVPDGEGALIDYNNGRQRFREYSAPVYGRDLATLDILGGSVIENIAMPVFGAKCNDNAFLAVITEGEACGKIKAYTSGKISSYNQVYSMFTFRECQTDSISGNTDLNYKKAGLDYSENMLMGGNYVVEYLFLDKEQADYSGMSRRYREYLAERGMLNKSELADNSYIVLDLYGAVVLEEYFLGVKRPVITAMTTYQDVCNIVEDLKAKGVEHLIINYVGALDGGLENKMTDEFKMESVLGSKKEFQNMVQYLEQEGVILFVENNPIYIYSGGNGYDIYRDSSEGFYETPAYQYNYALHTRKAIADQKWFLLKHDRVLDLMENYVSSAVSKGCSNVSVAVMGEYLYSDFTDDDFTSKVQSQQLFAQVLEDTASTADYLMVHGGNAYSLPYADIITDVAMGNSNYDISNRSIPFYQMVVHGSVAMAGSPVNEMSDYHGAFLKAIETGCNLKYNLLCEDLSVLIDSKYNDMMSYSYDYWVDTIVEQYSELQKAIGGLSDVAIVSHEQLEDEVFMSVYENGWKVIVNYNEEAFNYSGKVVEGRNYIVMKGDL